MPSAVVPHDILDLSLAKKGRKKIEWASEQMPVLRLIQKRFLKEKPLKGIELGACLHVTSETANLMLTLKAGGAHLSLCASNPLSTQDEVAAALVADFSIPVFAVHGEDKKTYYRHIGQVLDFHPQLTMDDGADLVASLHKLKIQSAKGKITIQNSKRRTWEFIGSSEETTTGVVRLRALEREQRLRIPVLAVNDSDTKHLFDNRYGTGQSTIDGILRATNVLLAGKTFVVCGYGWCSRGIALRAKGMGANVIVTEVDAVRALEAVMDGYRVMPFSKAVLEGDIFVTSTGDKAVITVSHMRRMKNGALLANAGHFNVEIDVLGLEKMARTKREIRTNLLEYTLKNSQKLYLLGEGRLVNLVAAEGHPAEVMDMSFANQALAAEYFVKNKGKLEPRVYRLPKALDQVVARLKLRALGLEIDRLTRDQRNYLRSWGEGT